MGNDNTGAGSIENDEVQNQVLVESIAVRYYKPKPNGTVTNRRLTVRGLVLASRQRLDLCVKADL